MSTTWKARPTTYKGIHMRSRLEAKYAASLDARQLAVRWEYEPQAFASERGQYLPDFLLIRILSEEPIQLYRQYVEVKPTLELGLRAMERMQVIWESEPGAVLSVVVAGVGTFIAYGQGDKWRFLREAVPV